MKFWKCTNCANCTLWSVGLVSQLVECSTRTHSLKCKSNLTSEFKFHWQRVISFEKKPPFNFRLSITVVWRNWWAQVRSRLGVWVRVLVQCQIIIYHSHVLAKYFFCSLGNTTVERRAGSVAMQGNRTSEEGSENQSRLTEQIDSTCPMFTSELPRISSLLNPEPLWKNFCNYAFLWWEMFPWSHPWKFHAPPGRVEV